MKTQAPTKAYPLQWPEGWIRDTNPIYSRFDRKLTINKAYKEVMKQVKSWGGRNLIVSSNLALNLDGETPRSGQREPADVGVAIYFIKEIDGVDEQVAIPCDTFDGVEDNLWAIAMTIDSLRRISRYGAGQLMKAAFKGFLALPDPNAKPWWEVLGVLKGSPHEHIRFQYKALVTDYHPDLHPNDPIALENFLQVQKAWEEYDNQNKEK